MPRFQKVTGVMARTYTAEDVKGMKGEERRNLLGNSFIYEQLECGHLGQFLGIAGSGRVKKPAVKRTCDLHDV